MTGSQNAVQRREGRMMYNDGKAELRIGEGRCRELKFTKSAVNDGKSECCKEGEHDVNDGKA
jgi:hypothetical protein